MALVGTVGNVDKITVGSVELVDISNLKCVGAIVSAAGVGTKYSTPRSQFATSGYQVGGGVSFRVLAIRMVVIDAAATGGSSDGWGYADNDVGLTSAAAPTSTVGSNVMRPGPGRGGYGSVFTVSGKAEVPATKYLYVFNDAAAAHWTIYGYEV